ncbi:MAG: hypothetical protein KGJ93_02170 [Patescibacteria group bacterium]|nr:hypothetical protein [Patescibacteria group bacterium]
MGGLKKSAYIFLCSLLGVMLFMILQQLAMMSYLVAVSAGSFGGQANFSFLDFAAVNYLTLLLSMLLGSWYGIWLGLDWYEKVYEQGLWRGFWIHSRHILFPWRRSQDLNLRQRIEEVKENLEGDLAQAAELARQMPREMTRPEPIKRRVVRRRPTVRKVKKTVLA